MTSFINFIRKITQKLKLFGCKDTFVDKDQVNTYRRDDRCHGFDIQSNIVEQSKRFFLKRTLFSSGASDFAEPASGMSLPQPVLSWVWLVDLERTVALLVGRCLGGMLQGAPTSLEEQDTAYWLKTPLFSNGLEMEIPQLGRKCTDARVEVLSLVDLMMFLPFRHQHQLFTGGSTVW